MPQRVKVYPVRGRFLIDTPRTVQFVDSKAEAERLISTGAFTDNPRDPDRDTEAVDATTNQPDPADAGSSDSEKE